MVNAWPGVKTVAVLISKPSMVQRTYTVVRAYAGMDVLEPAECAAVSLLNRAFIPVA